MKPAKATHLSEVTHPVKNEARWWVCPDGLTSPRSMLPLSDVLPLPPKVMGDMESSFNPRAGQRAWRKIPEKKFGRDKRMGPRKECVLRHGILVSQKAAFS